MAELRAFGHVGVTVADLASALAFFGGLGLELEGRPSSKASSSTPTPRQAVVCPNGVTRQRAVPRDDARQARPQ
jgi:catechol 2,3-dioxygenase-like lactoylglutathione lyase family enzyme